MLAKAGNDGGTSLADLFCREASARIEDKFRRFFGTSDAEMYRVAQQVLRGEHAWLESGIIRWIDDDERVAGQSSDQESEPFALEATGD